VHDLLESRGIGGGKAPWYVVKRSCPIFSSTLILRSVDSTQAFAAGDNVFAAFLEAAVLAFAANLFAEVPRF